MKIVSQKAEFLTNYGPGWIGFLSRKDNFISEGINWFSRWDDLDHVPISHVLNIVGKDSTIEALEPMVAYGCLSEYLEDAEVALLVRRPRTKHFTAIVTEAQKRLGEKYNNRLIGALAVSETFLGHALNRLTGGGFERFLVRRVDRPDQWICSKLGIRTLEQPDLIPLGGVLKWLPATVKPIDLFEDECLFEPGAFELLP